MVVDRNPLFFAFSLAFGHLESFVSWLSQFVVSVAAAIPLISSLRPRNKVLNEQQ